MKYCKKCNTYKKTRRDMCPDCGAYLPSVKVITPALLFGFAAILITIIAAILINVT